MILYIALTDLAKFPQRSLPFKKKIHHISDQSPLLQNKEFYQKKKNH
jgi:hypothetical protein